MKTVTVERFIFSSFDEMNAEQKSLVIDELRKQKQEEFNTFGFFWADEAINSIKEGLKVLGFELRKWSIDFFNGQSDFRLIAADFYDIPEAGRKTANWLIYVYYYRLRRAKKYGKRTSRIIQESQDCPFTGVCYDEDFLFPVRDYLKNPTSKYRAYDMEELAIECAERVVHSVESEIEYWLSDEGIEEDAEGRGLEYIFEKDEDEDFVLIEIK